MLLRESLVHLVVLGAGLFLLVGLARKPVGDGAREIRVTSGRVEQLAGSC